MNPLSDLHLHTTYCDGKDTPRAMTEQALSLGYHSLGICCHSALPFQNDWSAQNEAAFKAELAALKAEFCGRISLSFGIECDGESEVPFGYDYVIASTHHLRQNGKVYAIDESKDAFLNMLNEGFAGDSVALCKAYFEAVTENVKRLKPQVVGHFDLIKKYTEADPACTLDEEAFLSFGKAALKEIVKICPTLEVNVGAISRGLRTTPYPQKEFLFYWRELGGSVIITSDAHKKEHLGFAFAQTLSFLCELGFDSVLELCDGKLRSIMI
ncbi:MAG: histidinol-phosphatase HisJ family protein [Clostridia bacterium]|nr:histidinol-phosphatase HisJ family protein [Clostridia bacterium]